MSSIDDNPQGLSMGHRDHGLIDLLVFHKTRKIIVYWTPFLAVVGGAAIWLSQSVWTLAGGAVFGVMTYTLIEYVMHRFVYHVEPEARWVRFITNDLGRKHMGHHRNPGEYGGGINGNQGPIIALASLLAVGAALSLFPAFLLMAVAAGALNYVLQEFVHFGTHHLPMKNSVAAVMKRHHMLHHYRDGGANFGLFWPFWDYVFGTDHAARAKRARAN